MLWTNHRQPEKMGIWHFISGVLLCHLFVMAFKITTVFSDSNAQQVVDDVDMRCQKVISISFLRKIGISKCNLASWKVKSDKQKIVIQPETGSGSNRKKIRKALYLKCAFLKCLNNVFYTLDGKLQRA